MSSWTLATALQDAAPLAATGTAIVAVIGLASLFVRQLVSQQSGWQVLVTAAEHRASAAEVIAAACEVKTVAAEARIDVLELQLDEVRRQLAEARKSNATLRKRGP